MHQGLPAQNAASTFCAALNGLLEAEKTHEKRGPEIPVVLPVPDESSFKQTPPPPQLNAAA